MITINGLEQMRDKVGEELGISDWHAVTQENAHQWWRLAFQQ